MKDLDWLVPSTALTLISAVFALTMIPDYSGIIPALMLLPVWLAVAAILASLLGIAGMMAARVQSPIGRIVHVFTREWRSVAVIAVCVLIAGINMIAFMWIKPLLNYLVPFWADPLLADVDRALFLGHEPWTLLTWLNSTPTALLYHRGWFAMMILTLLLVARSSPSPEKSAIMVTYFVLWSIVGPVIHTLLPAAGPIFYEQMGYGDRFAALEGVAATHELAAYLWTIYEGEGFGPGAGISAMPSLHITTMVWMIIAVQAFARRWVVLMAGAGILIFLLSISLGWHYAVDGIGGGGCAWLCYRTLLAYYRRKTARGAFETDLLPKPA